MCDSWIFQLWQIVSKNIHHNTVCLIRVMQMATVIHHLTQKVTNRFYNTTCKNCRPNLRLNAADQTSMADGIRRSSTWRHCNEPQFLHNGNEITDTRTPSTKTLSQSPCTALTAGERLPLGLCRQTASGFWKSTHTELFRQLYVFFYYLSVWDDLCLLHLFRFFT